ncbi:MAG: carbon starvation CstA family protein [Bryobacterales bacterium]
MIASIWAGLVMTKPDLGFDVWVYLLLGLRLCGVGVAGLAAAATARLSQLDVALPGPRTGLRRLFCARPGVRCSGGERSACRCAADLPFVFIVIACGAVSGFHGLVSSGTTSKQIDKETDAVPIGYGGMIGESLLGLMAVLACTAGFSSPEGWQEHYASWTSADTLAGKMKAFIDGAASFVAALGVPMEVAQALIALVAVSFALTSLDSGTRLLRYNIEEIASSVGGQLHRALLLVGDRGGADRFLRVL